MKKIVRRSHIKENFRANLVQEQSSINEALPVLGWMAANALVNAAVRYGPSVVSKILSGAAKTKPTGAAQARVPNTGYGPWGRISRRGGGGKGKGGKSRPKNKGSLPAAAAAGGAAGALLGGGGSGTGKPDIYGKDRPRTGFDNRIQGIDPNRSGELRRSAGFWDTEVGRRLLYGKSGGGLVAPPNPMSENKVYTQLQEMVNESIATREINNILVTQDMAKNIVQLHEALNTNNKKLLEESVQSKDGFFEVLDFSVRN